MPAPGVRDYLDRWGHPVLAVESFTDPARHRGTCYAAAGFTALGTTSWYARTGGGSESYTFHGEPKTYWLKPLHRHALAILAAPFDALATFPPTTRPVIDINRLPLDHGEDNLLDLMYTVTDTRHDRGVRHDLASILTTVVAASLCGAGGYGAIAQWATHESQDGLRSSSTSSRSMRATSATSICCVSASTAAQACKQRVSPIPQRSHAATGLTLMPP